jgi:sterol desaturase/sphingolipid hydroxylase (fatty acid hydroxylase superfamily)
MKLIAKFQELSTALKILVLAIVVPLLVVLVGPLSTVFGLPLIGYAISLNSIKSNRRSKDNLVNLLFAGLSVIALALFMVLRTPPFVTDWEGGNPLDGLITLLLLAFLGVLAIVWLLAGWVAHRFVVNVRARRLSRS